MDAPQGTATSSGNAMKYLAIGCGGLLFLGLIVGGLVTWYAARKVVQLAENPGYTILRTTVAANPDLETLSSNAKTGTLTVLDKRTGKTTTLTVDAVKDGKLVIEADGTKVEMQGGPNGGSLIVHGKDGESLVAQGGPGGGSMVVTGADGKVQINAQGGSGAAVEAKAPGEEVAKVGEVPVPAWVPLYPGAAVADGGGMVATTDEGTTGTVTYTTADAPAKVLDNYALQLQKAGFPVKQKLQTGEGGMLVAATDDGKRTVTVMLSVDSGKTALVLAFVEKK